ncbi:MAG: PilZ domain-containing protein [Rhodospirillales bacterium]|nr:PilZ domain-containing protein [Rhodospirillales bacterium]
MPDKEIENDKRRAPRWKVFEIASVSSGGRSEACVIDNVSDTGALVSSELVLAPGDNVIFDLEGFGKIPATVAYIRDTYQGLAFNMDEEMAARFAAWVAEVEKED